MPHIVPKYFYLITVEFPMPDGGAEKAASSGVFQALPGGKTRSRGLPGGIRPPSHQSPAG